MCFSAQADMVGAAVVGAIGIDAACHVRERHGHMALAVLPLLLAVHQLDEIFVWWGLQGHVSPEVGRVALWIYLLFAFVALPVFVPAAILAVEPSNRRRWVMAPFLAIGAVVSATLLAAMIRGPVTARLAPHHLAYGIGLKHGLVVVGLYIVATCGSPIFSGYRHVAVFGVINLIAVAVLAGFMIDGFASLWCAWAAITSGAIAAHLRFAKIHRAMPYALS